MKGAYIGFGLMIIQTIICDRYRNIKMKLHNEKINDLLNKKLNDLNIYSEKKNI